MTFFAQKVEARLGKNRKQKKRGEWEGEDEGISTVREPRFHRPIKFGPVDD